VVNLFGDPGFGGYLLSADPGILFRTNHLASAGGGNHLPHRPQRESVMNKHGHWDKPVRVDIEAKASAEAYGWVGKITYAEAGECPVPLRETTEQAVHLWVNKVMTMGHDKGKHYAPCALRLFIRSLGFEFNSESYRVIVKHIASALPGPCDIEDETDYAAALQQATKPDEGTVIETEAGPVKMYGEPAQGKTDIAKAAKPLPVETKEEEEEDWLEPVVRDQTVTGIGGGEEEDEIQL
jgi:hypothetical protein